MLAKKLTALFITLALCAIFANPAAAVIVYGAGGDGLIYTIDTDASTSVLLFDPGVVSEWYGATDSDDPCCFYATPQGGSLYRINVAALTATAIGTYGGVAIREIAYNEITGTLYATDYAYLYTVNTSDGSLTSIGPHNGPSAVWAMDYHPGIDELVAVNQTDNQTYYIDKGNGNASPVGPTGADRITDVWYDPGTGGMFAISNLPNKLWSINPLNGAATELGDLSVSMLGLGAPKPVIIADLDIKPGSCPNPLNIKVFLKPQKKPNSKKGGVLPVAVLGRGNLDVHDIDISTLLLEGVAPIRSNFEDVSTPVINGGPCECTTAGPDGITDLTLKFRKSEIAAVIGFVSDGGLVPLTLTGMMNDGTPIEATDCVLIRSKEPDLPAPLTFEGDEVALGPAVPNPFNPTTSIYFNLPEAAHVKLEIFTITGQRIAVLVDRYLEAGTHSHVWEATNLSSGVYFYRMRTNDFSDTKKLILLK